MVLVKGLSVLKRMGLLESEKCGILKLHQSRWHGRLSGGRTGRPVGEGSGGENREVVTLEWGSMSGGALCKDWGCKGR